VIEIVPILAEVSALPLPQAAARYAAEGVPVFPCVAGEKRPLTTHGFHDATTDPRTVRAWWDKWPVANIGIPTGAFSGIDVVDIDRRPEHSGFAAFERARRSRITGRWEALIRTPSGGIHAYYPTDVNHPQQSWQAPSAHIDFRGDGGYILAPPSIAGTASNAHGYSVIATANRQGAAINADALRSFLEPLPAAPPRPRRLQPVNVEGLAAWVAARGEGERNRALFWAACRAAETGTQPDQLHAVLGAAAEEAGLTAREAATTIRSALRVTAGRCTPALPARAHQGPPTKRLDNGPLGL
jgi:hypothetical protein